MTTPTFQTRRHLAKDLLVVTFTALLFVGVAYFFRQVSHEAPAGTAAVVVALR